jgi:hypothetical protein
MNRRERGGIVTGFSNVKKDLYHGNARMWAK